MRDRHVRWIFAFACIAGIGGAAANARQPAFTTPEQTRALAAAGEAGEFAQRLRAHQLLLRRERTYYPALFRAAYARYPRIPAGMLEAIAYTQSRWHNLRSDRDGTGNGHMPRGYGVMGLYQGEGFADQIAEAAALLGVDAEKIKRNPGFNILAAAALLERALRAAGPEPDIEAQALALQRYAGFSATGAVGDYARASFAFDVLLALDRGVDDNGIRVPERAVEWERAFPVDMLVKLHAPMVRLDIQRDTVEAAGIAIDPISEQLRAQPPLQSADGMVGIASTDYGPALWVPSPNYSARGDSVREVVVHTMQGSYAGSIAWFQNPDSQVSAHYLIRSSDGQVTQMVRESQKAWHARSHNPYSIGIEHEGYVNNASWYTTAMYNASAALVRAICPKYAGVTCANAYQGAATSYDGPKLGASVHIKGHQHLTDNTHTDPGINWNWSRYYSLINPAAGGTTLLDTFESSVGHFVTSPTYSGSTTGIATSSSIARNCSLAHGGTCSLNVRLVDNASSSADWAVRLLSGSGNPGSNVALARSGRIGFWVYSGGTGMSVAVGIDDSDGTERSTSRAIPANSWAYVEWSLSDAAQWTAWAGGSNGAITASSVKLDAIWFYRAQTSYPVNLYVDDVQLRN